MMWHNKKKSVAIRLEFEGLVDVLDMIITRRHMHLAKFLSITFLFTDYIL